MQYWNVIGCQRGMSTKSLLSYKGKDNVVSMSCGLTCNSRMNFSWQEGSYQNQFLTAFSVLPVAPHTDKYGGTNLAFES